MTDRTMEAAHRIPDRRDGPLARALKSWEALLLAVALAIAIANSLASPYFLDPWNLSDASFNFTEKGIIAIAMAFVVITGEMDLSVASIIALASTAMGAAAEVGMDTPTLVTIGLAVGLVCGAFNGALVAGFGLPSIVATIGTMSLYRGISYVVLGDQVYKNYPASFAVFGQGYVWWVFSIEFVSFLVIALIGGIILHRTIFGRHVYAIGNNPLAARFSGVKVRKIKFILFLATGVASALASIMLTSRLGSTRPSIALGWEMAVVTMAVLGGVDINGGSGRMLGVVIAAFVMGLVTFGLGLLNVPGTVMNIIIGAMLIAVIAIPRIARKVAPKSAA
jgi:rhamnose transport system permease protein